MTDIEIDRALALAIGWKRILPNPETAGLKQCWVWTGSVWRLFDHKNWNVIGPIGERYNVFPYQLKIGEKRGKWNVLVRGKDYVADTPQKAIALAVIGALT